MSGPKPDDTRNHEPTWVQEARDRGLKIETSAGAVIVITKPDPRPLWRGGESDERDKAAREGDDQAAPQAAEDDC